MDQEKSLTLFKQGENAWNIWANEMLAKKNALMSAFKSTGGDSKQWEGEYVSWYKEAKADFSNHSFGSDVDFRNFQFPGEVLFISAKFQGHANFEGAEFHDTAFFQGVTFSEFCGFRESTFREMAKFSGVEFKNIADFGNVTFMSDANFDLTKFGKYAYFNFADFEGRVSFQEAIFSDRAVFWCAEFKRQADFKAATFFRLANFAYTEFEGDALFPQCSFSNAVYFGDSSFKKFASFKAIRGKSIFSLHNVKFRNVPDFTEAHFEEAPQFDDVELKPEGFKKSQAHESKPNLPSHWRALRRLAIQAHDHERELQFFKGEIIARRGSEDKRTHARYWFGLLYQLLSDFGRSMGRPLIWLGISLMLFAAIYAFQSPADWYQPLIKPVCCVDGSGTSRTTAFGVSVINAFPFAAISSSDLLNQYYACLYGIQESSPAIPYVVTFASVIQFFISAVLLFLFLLAVRNHFRIK